MERDGITVKTHWGTEWRDLVNQTYSEKQETEVDNNGRVMKFKDLEELKFIFPRVQNTDQVEREVRVFGMVGRNRKYVISRQNS
jgi:hypothetical protein